MTKRPFILSIAGFDPSNGAGTTSDIKTMEALKCYGLSVCSAITVQNENEFVKVEWVSLQLMIDQMEVLFKKYDIEIVKIGIVENWKILDEIISYLLAVNPQIKIILDPILKSSSSFSFHEINSNLLDKLLSKIYLLTPNYEEIKALFPDKSIEDTIEFIRSKTNLYLKGGHRESSIGMDELYTSDSHYTFNPTQNKVWEKHGSGCILSSSIAAYLALDFPLSKACYKAKQYTEVALSSNNSLLAFHK